MWCLLHQNDLGQMSIAFASPYVGDVQKEHKKLLPESIVRTFDIDQHTAEILVQTTPFKYDLGTSGSAWSNGRETVVTADNGRTERWTIAYCDCQ